MAPAQPVPITEFYAYGLNREGQFHAAVNFAGHDEISLKTIHGDIGAGIASAQYDPATGIATIVGENGGLATEEGTVPVEIVVQALMALKPPVPHAPPSWLARVTWQVTDAAEHVISSPGPITQQARVAAKMTI